MLTVTAVDAEKHLPLSGQAADASAFTTGLGAVSRPHFSKLPTFPGELVLEELGQEAPALIEDAP